MGYTNKKRTWTIYQRARTTKKKFIWKKIKAKTNIRTTNKRKKRISSKKKTRRKMPTIIDIIKYRK